MPDAQPLTVNPRQENSALQILLHPPLISSQIKWDKIHLDPYRHSPHETPEHCYAQHLIVIHHFEHVVEVERVLDGRMQSEYIGNGDITVVPANVLHKVAWNRESNFSLLSLDPTYIANIAHEAVDGKLLEIVPHFSKPDPLIHQIGLSLKSALESNGLCSRLYADSLTTALAAHLVRYYSAAKPNIPKYSGGLPRHRLQCALEYIDAHLDQDMKLVDIAEVVGMSQYYFARLFKQSMGVAPHQYVIQQRVERAKQLLKQREIPLADIALQCGFANQGHLNRHFKSLTGVTPKDIRKK